MIDLNSWFKLFSLTLLFDIFTYAFFHLFSLTKTVNFCNLRLAEVFNPEIMIMLNKVIVFHAVMHFKI